MTHTGRLAYYGSSRLAVWQAYALPMQTHQAEHVYVDYPAVIVIDSWLLCRIIASGKEIDSDVPHAYNSFQIL